jgi:ribose 5-phosphate isomerase B
MITVDRAPNRAQKTRTYGLDIHTHTNENLIINVHLFNRALGNPGQLELNMKLAIGCDEAAFDLKELIKQHLTGKGLEVTDFGTYEAEPVHYPNIAFAVAEKVAQGEFDRAVLMCGTGIGMAIAANKVHGIRAAQCHDTYSAERASKSNDAQIITIGARVVGPELAKAIVDTWLGASFDGGRSVPKVNRIKEYEDDHLLPRNNKTA